MRNRRESRTSEEALRRTGELADQHRPAVCMWSKNVREWHRGLRRLVALYPVLNALALSCALHWGGPKRNWAARRKDCAPPRPYMRINSCAAAYGQIGTSPGRVAHCCGYSPGNLVSNDGRLFVAARGRAGRRTQSHSTDSLDRGEISFRICWT